MTVAELDRLCDDLQAEARTAATAEAEADALRRLEVAVAEYRAAVLRGTEQRERVDLQPCPALALNPTLFG